MGPKREQRMPMCTYGLACKRKGCAYRHPTKHVVNEDVVCMPFLTGNCLFGNKCRNKHVSPEEKAALLAKFSAKPCRFGAHCRTEGCLYKHPGDAKRLNTASSPSDADLAARLASQDRQKQAYEAALQAHQRQMDALQNQHQQQHQYQQHQQYQQYQQCQDYDNQYQYQNQQEHQQPFDKTEQTQQPYAYGVEYGQGFYQHEGAVSQPAGSFVQASTETNPWGSSPSGSNADFGPDGSPWATSGKDYFAASSQPWGPPPASDLQASASAQSSSSLLASASPLLSSASPASAPANPWAAQDMPTPAEAIQMPSLPPRDPVDEVTMTMAQRLKMSAAHKTGSEDTTTSGLASESSRAKAVRTKRIPQELWVDAAARNASTFDIPDPIQRFHEANSVHTHRGVLDLHFQSAYTYEVVLDKILPTSPFYEVDTEHPDANSGYVWVVTGSGHHTTQRLYKLFDQVRDYLDRKGYTYMIGKDRNGHQGAFYVRLRR
ncbi:Zinc finger CCCH domain-containing protein 3 [Hondaea fermentalgiana]|uniref:Zinc finger CCCH domain-containing protein 3 n=1 Tax=Hondaea fermentalgiana TaxID=2315210 RepID=A0A2R5GXP2_9STRA|nr:Zinc finger CCCH domain-containing protein 3 [Hondaea fermentalgiana]|eukprot:GBG33191.1 Zinc finger CCCH domain-containing protein 3 [Hondaea fermentalgiana]